MSFPADECVPNSILPALYCAGVVYSADTPLLEACKESIARRISRNHWCLDWEDSIYQRTHYHSTAHEALVVVRGTARLQLGGSRWGTIQEVSAGDVVFIPAGVGHKRISSSHSFLVFGLYPEGQDWDLQWGWRKHFKASQRRIKRVPLPVADPFFGKTGALVRYWR